MATRKPAYSSTVYQLKITLRDIRPPIWRRVQVQGSETLEHLHYVAQIAMGWTNSHLHSFSAEGVEYGVPMPDFGFDELGLKDESKVKLGKLISGEKFKLFYQYDFGDSWEHEILVEKVLKLDLAVDYPICLKAKRACPPEDCGGIWGYESFLEAIRDTQHPEHTEMLEWVGGTFDPEETDLDEINKELKRIAEWQRLSLRF